MKTITNLVAVLITSLFSLQVFAAVPPGNGAASFDIMLHSSCCYTGDAISADTDLWHAFFDEPATPGTAPGVTLTESQDLASLSNFDMLYISQASADALNAGDMAIIQDWTADGGVLVINEHEGGRGSSAFGTALGAGYEFSSAGAPSGDNMEVTNPAAPEISVPNILGNVELSNWGSSVHGSFDSVGAAYACSVDSVDGGTRLPVLCTGVFGGGAVILIGFDPECGNGCHDGHISNGPEDTRSGSELWENLVLFAGFDSPVPAPVPTMSRWSLTLMALLMLGMGFGVYRRLS